MSIFQLQQKKDKQGTMTDIEFVNKQYETRLNDLTSRVEKLEAGGTASANEDIMMSSLDWDKEQIIVVSFATYPTNENGYIAWDDFLDPDTPIPSNYSYPDANFIGNTYTIEFLNGTQSLADSVVAQQENSDNNVATTSNNFTIPSNVETLTIKITSTNPISDEYRAIGFIQNTDTAPIFFDSLEIPTSYFNNNNGNGILFVIYAKNAKENLQNFLKILLGSSTFSLTSLKDFKRS